MPDPKYSYEQLIEKVVRAKIALERAPKVEHKISCPMEDPESYAPCNCGASTASRPIEEAMRALKL